MLQKCPYCGKLIFFREKGHTKEDRCDLKNMPQQTEQAEQTE